MADETTKKPQVILRYSLFQEAVAKSGGDFHEAVDKSASSVAEDPQEQARLVAAFTNGMGALEEADTGSAVMSTAQNGIASRLQSLIVEQATEQGKVQQLQPARQIVSDGDTLTLPELLEVKFDSGDWLGWIGMAGLLLFKPKKSPWQAPPTTAITIADDTVIAVFADWGTGLYGAPPISNQIAKMGRCDVVLHLGDTYYAGRPNEIAGRLLQDWPKQSKALNLALNGNHEMYSGGVGYFKALGAAPFKQSSSCFALQNQNWLLLGLDSSYVDSNMDQAQVDWVTSMVNKATAKQKVLLFSHHQIYSQFDKNAGQGLQGALGTLLGTGRIYGWYFGHEHRLVVFDPHPQWGLKARCMGHGGFPEFRPDDLTGSAPNVSQWIPLAAKPALKVPSASVFDGPNRFISDKSSEQVQYVPHGFLVLEFSGNTVSETFKDPDGGIVRAKTAL